MSVKAGPRHVRRTASHRPVIVGIVGMLIGVCLAFYPFVGGWVASIVQSDQIASYSQESTTVGWEKVVEAARAYNASKTVMPSAGGGDEEYRSQLVFGVSDVMSRVVVPTVGIDLPVYHGTEAGTLERGAGHLFGSDLPVGGADRNSVVTAHTGLRASRMFDRLKDVKIGDVFYVRTGGWTGAYRVTMKEVKTPEEASLMSQRVAGRDLVTLVTCTPYSVNTHRLVVVGERTWFDESHDPIPIEGRRESVWPVWAAGVAVLVVLGVGVWSWRRVSHKEEHE